MRTNVKELFAEEESVLRPRRGPVEQVLNFGILMQKYLKHHRDLYTALKTLKMHLTEFRTRATTCDEKIQHLEGPRSSHQSSV